MSTTTYGSTYATSSGKNFIKSYITWEVSSSATTTTFSFTAGCHIDSGYTTNAKITVACLGQSKTVDDKGWGGGNHQMISGSTSWARTTSAQTKTVTCTLTLANGNTSVATVSVPVPALASYAVTYNANGTNVSNLPSNQTKYYNTSLTLSGTVPTRTGYTFLRWNTNASGTGTNYNPSQAYTGNSALTLYAIWQPYTYTVSYNANGGSGSVASQTKTYDVPLTLASGGFARSLHTLTGWNTQADGLGTPYALGGTYSAEANVTLYAVWHLDYIKPVITNFVAFRSDSGGNADDAGQYIHIAFDYVGGTVDGGSTYIPPEVKITIDGTQKYDTVQSSGTGSFSQTFGTYSENTSWDVDVKLFDSNLPSGTTVSVQIPSATFPLDILGDGSAMGVMTPAVSGQKLTLPYDSFINGNRIGGGGVIGAVQMFAGSTAPSGWLLCDGSAVSRSTYSALFAVIGTTYGTGDGSTTFNLPNLQGRVPVGASSSYNLGDTGGSADAIIPNHRHSVSAVTNGITGGSHTHKQQGWNGLKTYTSGTAKEVRSRYIISTDAQETGNIIASTHTHDLPSHNTNYEGESVTGKNMQPYVVMNYIINAGA